MVRTDYSDNDAWLAVVELLDAETPFTDAPVNHFVDDPAWAAASVDEVLAGTPDESAVVFVADATAMRAPYPLIAASTVTREDCEDDDEYAFEMEYGREFRVLPAGVAEVHANLFIANCDFPDLAAQAQEDGYYRGLAANEKAAPVLDKYREVLRQQLRALE